MRHAVLTAALALAPAAALAQEAGAIRKVDPQAMPLAALAAFPGVSNGFLTGRFDREGLYVAQGLMEQGSVFPPHAHPDQRVTVVLEGTMMLGEGEAFDEAALVAYPAGTVAMTPAGTFHFMAAPDGDVRVLEIGSGPSGATFAGGGQ